MGKPARFDEDGILVQGVAYLQGGIQPPLNRSSFAQDDNQVLSIPLIWGRVWDAVQTNLPGTSATDDLALIGGTFGSAAPTIRTSDLKAAGATTRYVRFPVPIPIAYVAGETFTLRFKAGMVTTVSDTTATLDVEAYLADRDGGIGADICATAAQSCNTLIAAMADLDFTITPATLSAGGMLDVRIALAINDGATGTAVIGCIGAFERVCDVKG